MKIIVGLLVAALILLSTSSLNSTAFADAVLPAQGIESIDIEVFVRDGCPHCAKAELFLQTLKREQPDLKIVVHEVSHDPAALDQLQRIAENHAIDTVRVPAFQIGGQLIVGYSDEITTGQLIRDALTQARPRQTPKNQGTPGNREAVAQPSSPLTQTFTLDFFGRRLSLDEIGLPLFTLSMGLLDGFNPCSLWGYWFSSFHCLHR